MLVYTIWDLIGIVCLMILVAVLVFGFIVYKISGVFENHHRDEGLKEMKCTITDEEEEAYEDGNGTSPCSDYGSCENCPYAEE